MREKNSKFSVIIAIIFLIVIIIMGIVKARNEFKNREIQANEDIEIIEQNKSEEQNVIKEIKEENKEVKENTITTSNGKEENTAENNSEKKQEENKIKVKSTFDENAFVEGHLEHYPNFCRTICNIKK